MNADAIHPNPEVARRLAHLYTLSRADMDLRLGDDTPYGVLLAKLGNPHTKLPPVVHVAGTNGKGSVIALLQAICECAGYKVHVYTSPHLLRFNERIRLAGQLITDTHFIDLYDRVFAINNGEPVTFFEFTTALAFLAFTQTPADIVLLETGMGGRLDCTNVVPDPALTVITKISYDHVQFLGDTLPKIAAEKAGIMKQGVPCIIAQQMDMDAVLPVFEEYAAQAGAALMVAGRDFPLDPPVAPSLIGAHQLENAAAATATARTLRASGFDLGDDDIQGGLTHANWPGRMQPITQGPVAALLPKDWELWFDGAHNDSGAMALAAQLKTWKKSEPDCPLHLVVAMSAHKDVSPFFHAITGTYDSITLVDLPNGQKPQTAAELKARLKNLPLTSCYEKSSINEAVKALVVDCYGAKARIIAAGSLYLYAQIV